MFTIKDDVEFCLLYTENYVRSVVHVVIVGFKGSMKRKKKDIDFDRVHYGARQAVQFRFFVYCSKHTSLRIAMKKAGGSFRKALDWSTHSESSLNNVKILFQFDNRSYSVYLHCI